MPTVNAGPRPARMTTRAESSASISAIAAGMSRQMSADIAFSFSGRLIQRVATCPSRSISMCS